MESMIGFVLHVDVMYSMKKQNPIAKEVRTPKYMQRIVKDKTIYDRKKL